ncbi:MAG TPA: UDP-N-acetylglucosamine 2-epimerase (non-hydrolyzing) [Gaiellales bacterium]|jgi:UDP-N-acetylglucosamine 2-epimerase|nr:UDP-N-acetylglucosamine 2-epimerase (non-hydrolyzing) [Gaiellales bacterium]
MRLLSVTGTRPQFVKAAPLHAELAKHVELVVADTGQHYDHELSRVFNEDLGLREPDVRLEVGSGSHAEQTAAMLIGIERAVLERQPDAMLVYGDTNSTLAGALVAAKLDVPLAHVEAGLRSFDMRMPEEVNRIVTDRLSRLLFCPSDTAVANLAAEGIRRGVELVGDVMVDLARVLGPVASARSAYPAALGLEPGSYALATVHRQANTEQPALGRLVEGLGLVEGPVVVPLHPRTRAALEASGMLTAFEHAATVLPPLGYLDFTALLRGARVCLTDSGGVQKEAYLHSVPCVTLRDSTEWVETVQLGWNILAGEPGQIAAAAAEPPRGATHPEVYGDGHAAGRMARLVSEAAWRNG